MGTIRRLIGGLKHIQVSQSCRREPGIGFPSALPAASLLKQRHDADAQVGVGY